MNAHAATQIIIARLDGSDRAAADGVCVVGSSPVLALCRALVEAGFDPAAALHVFRGDVLALLVRSIGEAARLEVASSGIGFTALRRRPPAAPNAPAATGHRARREAAA
jgi:hypothetical protein